MNNKPQSVTIEPNTTLGEWLIYWLETYIKPGTKPSTYVHYADYCYKHIMPILGKNVLNRVTTADIQRFLDFKATAGNLQNGSPLSKKSVEKMRAIIKLAMSKAYSAQSTQRYYCIPGAIQSDTTKNI